jgi:hypothetical protein
MLAEESGKAPAASGPSSSGPRTPGGALGTGSGAAHAHGPQLRQPAWLLAAANALAVSMQSTLLAEDASLASKLSAAAASKAQADLRRTQVCACGQLQERGWAAPGMRWRLPVLIHTPPPPCLLRSSSCTTRGALRTASPSLRCLSQRGMVLGLRPVVHRHRCAHPPQPTQLPSLRLHGGAQR